MRYQQFPLYLLVMVLSSVVLIIALGGGIFAQQEHWLFQWQHQMFSSICHQDPDRSFFINNQPMAVCSRCLGIYSSFWLCWLLMPLISRIHTHKKPKMLVGIFLLVNIVDVIGNMVGVWQNTLYSRLILGILLGGGTVQLFSEDFFQQKIQTNGDQYARITSEH